MSIATLIAKAGHTLTHQRRNDDRGGSGGREANWDTLATGVACWVQPASGRVQEAAARRDMVVSHSVYLTTDLDALADDRLVADTGDDETHTLLVRGQVDLAGLRRCWRIDCEEKL